MAELRPRVQELIASGVHPRIAREMAAFEAKVPKGRRDPTLRDLSRPTGPELFDAMSEAEQDEAFGPEIAAAVRSGEVKLSDLVVKSPMEGQPDFITQASLTDLGLDPKD